MVSVANLSNNWASTQVCIGVNRRCCHLQFGAAKNLSGYVAAQETEDAVAYAKHVQHMAHMFLSTFLLILAGDVLDPINSGFACLSHFDPCGFTCLPNQLAHGSQGFLCWPVLQHCTQGMQAVMENVWQQQCILLSQQNFTVLNGILTDPEPH